MPVIEPLGHPKCPSRRVPLNTPRPSGTALQGTLCVPQPGSPACVPLPRDPPCFRTAHGPRDPRSPPGAPDPPPPPPEQEGGLATPPAPLCALIGGAHGPCHAPLPSPLSDWWRAVPGSRPRERRLAAALLHFPKLTSRWGRVLCAGSIWGRGHRAGSVGTGMGGGTGTDTEGTGTGRKDRDRAIGTRGQRQGDSDRSWGQSRGDGDSRGDRDRAMGTRDRLQGLRAIGTSYRNRNRALGTELWGQGQAMGTGTDPWEQQDELWGQAMGMGTNQGDSDDTAMGTGAELWEH